jgi:glycosyltransferase 2 family protein
MKKLAILTTMVMLVVLYARIDRQALLGQLRHMRWEIFCLSLVFFVPQMLVTVWRWRWMVWDVYPMNMLEAAKLILAGKALNALLPSKLGEASKAYFLLRHAHVALPKGVALVLLEKMLDMAGLCAMLLAGLFLTSQWGLVETSAALGALLCIAVVGGLCICRTTGLQCWLQRRTGLIQRLHTLLESWQMILTHWKQHRLRFAGILGLSCGLWFLHLAQIYLFFVALRSTVAVSTVFAYVPIGLGIGLLPFTIGGMGTRDSALIYLFAPYESAALMAGIGILCSMRYWVDTLLGLPFFHVYSFGKGP